MYDLCVYYILNSAISPSIVATCSCCPKYGNKLIINLNEENNSLIKKLEDKKKLAKNKKQESKQLKNDIVKKNKASPKSLLESIKFFKKIDAKT